MKDLILSTQRVMNVSVLKKDARNEFNYGTKIFNRKTKENGLLIKTWKNKFADAEIDYAISVDSDGKKYNISLDNITSFQDFK